MPTNLIDRTETDDVTVAFCITNQLLQASGSGSKLNSDLIVALGDEVCLFHPVSIPITDTYDNEMAEAPIESGIPAKALEYIKTKGLTRFVKEAVRQLEIAFESPVSPTYRVFSDPENGSEMLFVEVVSSDLKTAERHLSRFNYDWWYDQIGDAGHQVGFRVVKARGM